MVASKSKFKDWNVGNILGRNKDGFQQVNTDERDGMLDDDSDSEVSFHLISKQKYYWKSFFREFYWPHRNCQKRNTCLKNKFIDG